MHTVARIKQRRRYRRLLGLCFDCLQRALPGKTRCVYHLIQDNQYKRDLRARRVTKRGWKMGDLLLLGQAASNVRLVDLLLGITLARAL